ncbi:hypothetical protein JCGZ_21812 [Jatropha curcas]|uniref:Uncharacterized protein n=1 Tax=Jatropha curcas TaxID=180498 RepID=A0A067JBX6_JATCU|nr:hypothetical protein JCGZ_21812 [Jatropha curcas]
MDSSTSKLLCLNTKKMATLILLLIIILNINPIVTARTLHPTDKQIFAANKKAVDIPLKAPARTLHRTDKQIFAANKKVVDIPLKAPAESSGPNPCTQIPTPNHKHCPNH